MLKFQQKTKIRKLKWGETDQYLADGSKPSSSDPKKRPEKGFNEARAWSLRREMWAGNLNF